MPGPTDDDIHALRRDGDLPRYLRDLIRPTRHTPTTTASTAHGPHHQPGAWPAGTHPPDSAICRPDCSCALDKPPDTA